MYNYLSLHRTKGWMKFFTGRLLVGLAILILGLSVGLPQIATAQETETLPAPTILSPTPSEIVTQQPPVFKGVTLNDTAVDVYIDGTINGQAKIKNGPEGTASWGYEAFLPLTFGEHTVYTVAKRQADEKISGESAHLKFYLEQPFPAPVLFAPVVDKRTSYDKPWIKGVAKNGSLINIYINGQLDGTIKVADHPSGTASFEYQSKATLSDGWHSVNATSRDKRGKQSKWSNSVVFEIRSDNKIIGSSAPQLSARVPGTPTSVAAPTLLEPQTGSVITQGLPTINGLAHNDQAIEIFINGQLNGEISKQQHESGVFSFSYKPFLPLPPGVHVITARSVDLANKKSAHSNELSFLIRPKDTQLVISPTGVQLTRLVQIPGTVAAVNTEPAETPISADNEKSDDLQISETTEETASDEQMPAEETKIEVTETPELTMDEEIGKDEVVDEPEPTPEEISVTEEPNLESDEELSVTSDKDVTETDVVVIGERSTTTAATSEQSGNTILIVVLAIAAIIIIGLISWYTSREDRDDRSGGTAEPETPEAAEAEDESEIETPAAKTDSVWEDEPVETSTPEYSSESVEDEFPPPPPPPPALGI